MEPDQGRGEGGEPQLNCPSRPLALRRRDVATAGAAAFAALLVYTLTLAPTVTGEDAGELAAAAYTLGIPHPTGYPLWCLLAKLAIKAVPAGEVVWRAALVSAVFGALTAAVTVLLTLEFTQRHGCAVAAALGLAFSRELWEQSVIAEVYTLNAFILALCALWLLRWRKTQRPWHLYAAALTYGLGLCNHSTMFLAGPVFACFVLLVDRKPRRMRRHAATALLIAIGFSINLYLPIRSRANPAMDWGNPETLAGFWDVLTRAQYRFIVTDGPRSLGRFVAQSWTLIEVYAREFTPWIAVLALIGLVPAWRKNRPACALLVALLAVIALGSILIPNFDLDRRSIWINTTYWIPLYVFAAVFVGVALDRVTSTFQHTGVRVTATGALGLIVIASPLIANYHHNNRSDSYLARDYALNLFSTMERDAVYFGSGDHTLFPLAYLQIVEGVRPDVLIANKYGYPVPEVYKDMPPALKAGFARVPSRKDEEAIFAWLLDHTDRPVYSTSRRTSGSRRVINAGLLYRYLAEGENVPQRDLWANYTWHALDDAEEEEDWSAGLILFEYHFARGRKLLDEGHWEEALDALAAAAGCAGDDKDGLNNLGSLCAEYGLLESAADYWERALETDPDYVMALINLARLYQGLGDNEKALTYAERALARHPANTDARDLRESILSALKTPPS